MIIPANSPKSPLVNKIQTLRSDDEDEATSSIAPPSYGAHQESQPVSPVTPRAVANTSGTSPEDPLLVRPDDEGEPVTPKVKRWPPRLGLTFFWGFVILCFLVLIISKFFSHSYPDYKPDWLKNSTYPTLPPGIKVLQCTGAKEWMRYGGRFSENEDVYPRDRGGLFETVYQVPVIQDLMFLETMGDGQMGSLKVTSASVIDDVAQVQVKYPTNNIDNLEDVHVCRARKGSKKHGIIIVTPSKLPIGAVHVFQIELILPQITRAPIKAFALNLRNFEVTVDDIGELYFDQFSIWTTERRLLVENVLIRNGELRNHNAEISGYASVSGALDVRSSKGDIDLDIQLADLPDSDSGVSALQMLSNNGAISTRLTLTGRDTSQFSVDLSTSNAKLSVDVSSQPVGSKLLLNGRTSNAPVSAFLDPSYEGKLHLESFNARGGDGHVDFNLDGNQPDPAGRGRKKQADIDYYRTTSLRAYLYWGERPPQDEPQGAVSLITVNKPITVKA